MHPFQRCTAISYVWGNTINPSYIILDGDKKFPVTQNLHKALKALRSASKGLCIWVDALCINQTDFEEEKIQIGLMRRVYHSTGSLSGHKIWSYWIIYQDKLDNYPLLTKKTIGYLHTKTCSDNYLVLSRASKTRYLSSCLF